MCNNAVCCRGDESLEIDLLSQAPVVSCISDADTIAIRPGSLSSHLALLADGLIGFTQRVSIGIPSAVLQDQPHAVQIVDFQRDGETSNFILKEDVLDQVCIGSSLASLGDRRFMS